MSKNTVKKLFSITIVGLLGLSMFTACGKSKETTKTTEATTKATTTEATTEATTAEATTGATTAEATTEAATEANTAAAEGAAVKYGDQIRVSVEKKETLAGNEGEEPQFESAGEATFVVSKDTEEFKQTDYEMPEDEVEANVNKAIGKKVGESFELSFEYGDGGVTYRYTILQIN
ncbi:MAG: hypothetical protein K6F55_07105 [Eubacterium sp.]|nr:hypothetical protein [Eubacterium sp.]